MNACIHKLQNEWKKLMHAVINKEINACINKLINR